MTKSILVLSLLAASMAFAQTDKAGEQPKKAVEFGEIIARCQQADSKYGDFRQIVAPQDLKISCTEYNYDYVSAAPGSVPFNNRRWVDAAMTSNKFDVMTFRREFPVAQQKGGSCPVYKQIVTTTSVDYQISCSELLGKASAKNAEAFDQNTLCNEIVTTKKGSNPKMGKTEETGVFISTCAGAVPQGKDGKAIF